jgi:uncharacterized protein YkwD
VPYRKGADDAGKDDHGEQQNQHEPEEKQDENIAASQALRPGVGSAGPSEKADEEPRGSKDAQGQDSTSADRDGGDESHDRRDPKEEIPKSDANNDATDNKGRAGEDQVQDLPQDEKDQGNAGDKSASAAHESQDQSAAPQQDDKGHDSEAQPSNDQDRQQSNKDDAQAEDDKDPRGLEGSKQSQQPEQGGSANDDESSKQSGKGNNDSLFKNDDAVALPYRKGGDADAKDDGDEAQHEPEEKQDENFEASRALRAGDKADELSQTGGEADKGDREEKDQKEGGDEDGQQKEHETDRTASKPHGEQSKVGDESAKNDNGDEDKSEQKGSDSSEPTSDKSLNRTESKQPTQVAGASGHDENKDSSAESQDPENAISAHNKAREEKGSKPLEWSSDLANDAQAHAEKLVQKGQVQHSSHPDHGENLYVGLGDASYEQAVQIWLEEGEGYNGEKVGRGSDIPVAVDVMLTIVARCRSEKATSSSGRTTRRYCGRIRRTWAWAKLKQRTEARLSLAVTLQPEMWRARGLSRRRGDRGRATLSAKNKLLARRLGFVLAVRSVYGTLSVTDRVWKYGIAI